MSHPLEEGNRFKSPGGSYTYKVIGPCCRLYDREELPYPCCNLSWRGKAPSWNRIGKRFIPDIAASRCPSYSVEGIDVEGFKWLQVLTFYHQRLSSDVKAWWYSKVPKSKPFPTLIP